LWLFSHFGNEKLSFYVPSAEEDKKITEEGAEGAEIIPWKPLASFGLLRSVGNKTAFPFVPWALSLWPFLSPRALRPLWLSFFSCL
jgi:hypothetical protein